ncbi:uncharacterized protein G2W53_004858 [Senna tora]|uniref:Uncharacterized protein n=1 Tax=Senna tora TaxID=362788 RepID=A0A834XCB9_9FABA|nr:uncharacterized protein G2W53_004858 [Senna tora]
MGFAHTTTSHEKGNAFENWRFPPAREIDAMR